MSVELQNQLDQANMNIKGLYAQLDATKQMLNEHLAANLQLRTNIVLLQQTNKDLSDETNVLKNQVLKLQAPKMDEEVKPAE